MASALPKYTVVDSSTAEHLSAEKAEREQSWQFQPSDGSAFIVGFMHGSALGVVRFLSKMHPRVKSWIIRTYPMQSVDKHGNVVEKAAPAAAAASSKQKEEEQEEEEELYTCSECQVPTPESDMYSTGPIDFICHFCNSCSITKRAMYTCGECHATKPYSEMYIPEPIEDAICYDCAPQDRTEEDAFFNAAAGYAEKLCSVDGL